MKEGRLNAVKTFARPGDLLESPDCLAPTLVVSAPTHAGDLQFSSAPQNALLIDHKAPPSPPPPSPVSDGTRGVSISSRTRTCDGNRSFRIPVSSLATPEGSRCTWSTKLFPAPHNPSPEPNAPNASSRRLADLRERPARVPRDLRFTLVVSVIASPIQRAIKYALDKFRAPFLFSRSICRSLVPIFRFLPIFPLRDRCACPASQPPRVTSFLLPIPCFAFHLASAAPSSLCRTPARARPVSLPPSHPAFAATNFALRISSRAHSALVTSPNSRTLSSRFTITSHQIIAGHNLSLCISSLPARPHHLADLPHVLIALRKHLASNNCGSQFIALHFISPQRAIIVLPTST
jgi:hypothetical protein